MQGRGTHLRFHTTPLEIRCDWERRKWSPHIFSGAQRRKGHQKYALVEAGGVLRRCGGSGGYHHICKLGVISILPVFWLTLKRALLRQLCPSGGSVAC